MTDTMEHRSNYGRSKAKPPWLDGSRPESKELNVKTIWKLTTRSVNNLRLNSKVWTKKVSSVLNTFPASPSTLKDTTLWLLIHLLLSKQMSLITHWLKEIHGPLNHWVPKKRTKLKKATIDSHSQNFKEKPLYLKVTGTDCSSVAVYPRSLRAKRMERTSPDRLNISGNCIKTIDYSISIYILMLYSYIIAFTCSWYLSNVYQSPVNVHVIVTYWYCIRSTPVYWSRLGWNRYGANTYST